MNRLVPVGNREPVSRISSLVFSAPGPPGYDRGRSSGRYATSEPVAEYVTAILATPNGYRNPPPTFPLPMAESWEIPKRIGGRHRGAGTDFGRQSVGYASA